MPKGQISSEKQKIRRFYNVKEAATLDHTFPTAQEGLKENLSEVC